MEPTRSTRGGSLRGVQRVNVKADVDASGPVGVDAVEGAGEALPHSDGVHLPHGEGGDVQLGDHLSLGDVDVPEADEGDAAGIKAVGREGNPIYSCLWLQ